MWSPDSFWTGNIFNLKCCIILCILSLPVLCFWKLTLRLVLTNVRKKLHLRFLTGFWMCQCFVRHNYLSVNFATQSFCYFLVRGDSKLFLFQLLIYNYLSVNFATQSFLLLSCSWWFKAFSQSTFPVFRETHTAALQLAIKSYWNHRWHLQICSYINKGQKS